MVERGCDGAVLPLMCSVQRADAVLRYPVVAPPTWPAMDAAAIRDLTPAYWHRVGTTAEHAAEMFERRENQMIAYAVAWRAGWAKAMDDMRRDLGGE